MTLFHISPERVIASAGVGKTVVTTCRDVMRNRIIGIVVGAICGAFLGAGTGVVGAFGGASGLIVFALIGGIVGLLAVPDAVRLAAKLRHLRKKVGKK